MRAAGLRPGISSDARDGNGPVGAIIRHPSKFSCKGWLAKTCSGSLSHVRGQVLPQTQVMGVLPILYVPSAKVRNQNWGEDAQNAVHHYHRLSGAPAEDRWLG